MKDFAFSASHLDEFESFCSTAVRPSSLNPLSPRGTFDGGLELHAAHDIAAFSIRYGRALAVEMEPNPNERRMAFLFATKGHAQLVIGRERLMIGGGHGVVFNGTLEKSLHYFDGCQTGALMMSAEGLERSCAQLLGRDVEGRLSFDLAMPLDGPAGQSWQRLVDYATGELSNPQSLIRIHQTARRQLEQMVMTGFLLSHSHSFSQALLQPQAAAVPFYVKRAEDYIEAHFAEPLSLPEIAAHAGVGARSLQKGFQDFRQMTPMTFLRSVRLRHVRRILIEADPSICTVTDVALGCGFGHMGDFAAQYRRTFGETPSQTLLKKG